MTKPTPNRHQTDTEPTPNRQLPQRLAALADRLPPRRPAGVAPRLAALAEWGRAAPPPNSPAGCRRCPRSPRAATPCGVEPCALRLPARRACSGVTSRRPAGGGLRSSMGFPHFCPPARARVPAACSVLLAADAAS